jgi:hypothetical protein
MVQKALSPNHAPWDWKKEKAPQHIDTGLTVAATINVQEKMPSIESKAVNLGVGALKSDLVPYKNLECIEDGKEINEIR